MKKLTNLYSSIVWKHKWYAEALIAEANGENSYAARDVER